MTLQEFIADSVRKIPHPSVIGEVADLVYEKVRKVQGEQIAHMAVEDFIIKANKRFSLWW